MTHRVGGARKDAQPVGGHRQLGPSVAVRQLCCLAEGGVPGVRFQYGLRDIDAAAAGAACQGAYAIGGRRNRRPPFPAGPELPPLPLPPRP